MAHLTIIRGLPGSGKTTFANRISNNTVAADDFMLSASWDYLFDPAKLSFAHSKCFDQVKEWLDSGTDCVVHNVFKRRAHMAPYIEFCLNNSHSHTIILMDQQYESVHNVPARAIANMRRNWE